MNFPDYTAIACLVWYSAVLTICAVGIFQIRKNISRAPAPSVSNTLPLGRVPHVTIIRPVKGIEPYLYECLAATFYQTYPRERLTICFCISSRNDPALPILESLLSDFPAFDAKFLVEEEDPNLSGRDGRSANLGPNPKIRNMSRAYREAKGDLVWIIDCNVWISPPVAARMVDLLCGFTPPPLSKKSKSIPPSRKYSFVHQLPLVVDVSTSLSPQSTTLLSSGPPADPLSIILDDLAISLSGGLLEELFLSTSHAKFYTAISTVAIVPCIVGKSNLFRRSHLNALTTTTTTPVSDSREPGIDFFSDNICEDHLIGDLLWKSDMPESVRRMAECEGHLSTEEAAQRHHAHPLRAAWGNHGLLPPHSSNLATQPMSCTPLISYVDRRTRWLRVRKFTVTVATLVEPGTESLLCSAYGAWGLTSLGWCERALGIPQTWLAFCVIYFFSVCLWAMVDRYVWSMLQHGGTDAGDERPLFGRTRGKRRSLLLWVLAWLGRELLAFPIWAWAVVGGVTVVWRGRKFWVGTDMKVHEIEGQERMANGSAVGGKSAGKGRID